MKDNTDLLNIAICEDAAEDAQILKNYIEQSGVPAACACFTSGESFLQAFHADRYDLIFLDIYMGGMQGVEAAGLIRERDKNVMLAFTTVSLEHTLDSYRLGALKYLEKPVTASAVEETLAVALRMRKARPGISITLAGGALADLLLNSIQYMEYRGHAIEIHTADGILSTSRSVRMKDIAEKLPSPPFIRCHRSFIVNLDYVRRIDRKRSAFIMESGGSVDIRRGAAAGYEQVLDEWRLTKAGRIEL